MVYIILVNYNGAQDTLACVESLMAVEEPAFRIVVVDNGSTDDSCEILKRENQKRYIFLQADTNEGFAAGNNVGIRYAMQEGASFVVLLNNDTIVEPDFLHELVKACGRDRNRVSTCRIFYEKDRESVWYAGGAYNLKNGRTEHFHFGEKDGTEDFRTRRVTFISGCCMCLPVDVLEKVGLLDEEYFLYEEDTDYCIRLRRVGVAMAYTPRGIIFHKVSASANQKSELSQYYLLRNKYLLIRKQYQGAERVQPFVYATLQFLWRCIKGEYSFRIWARAFAAGMRGETGKTFF